MRPWHAQDHIKPAARAVLDAIIDEIEAAESPDDSDDDDAASDEAAGDASATPAAQSKTLQVQCPEAQIASDSESLTVTHNLL